MGIRPADYEPALGRAHAHTTGWLESLDTRRIGPTEDADAILARLGGPLPDDGTDPVEVVDLMATAEPGLMAIGSGRFFGWVIGGTQPAALAADWLVSA